MYTCIYIYADCRRIRWHGHRALAWIAHNGIHNSGINVRNLICMLTIVNSNIGYQLFFSVVCTTLTSSVPALVRFSISMFAFSWTECVNFDMLYGMFCQANTRRTIHSTTMTMTHNTCVCGAHVFVYLFACIVNYHRFTAYEFYIPWCVFSLQWLVCVPYTEDRKNNLTKRWNTTQAAAAMFIFVTAAPQKSSAFTNLPTWNRCCFIKFRHSFCFFLVTLFILAILWI